MSLDFGMFPIALLICALFIPLVYCIKWKRKELRPIGLLMLCSIIIVLLYPITYYLSNIAGESGYALGKFILFVIIPLVTLVFIEKTTVKKILMDVGVRRKRILASIVYGVGVAAITIVITLLVSAFTETMNVLQAAILFFDAFNEEFFFRGILFLYVLKKTNVPVAYLTSIIGFILVHPQHFTSLFLLSTSTQAILLTIVADKTKNIAGPWISHGLNRIIPPLIRVSLGL